MKATSARSVQPGINAQEYGSYQFMAPHLAEQERIGAFFQSLDKRLALQRAKIEKLEQLSLAGADVRLGALELFCTWGFWGKS